MEADSEKWLIRDEASLAGVLPRCSDVVASYGGGSYIYDVDEKSYLDFTSGIAVTNTGHCHPKVVDAITEQAQSLIHTSVTTHNTKNIELAERLIGLTPFMEDPQVFFCNSGAEAVDGALKLARMYTKQPGIIAFRGAFHGRTLGATSITTAKEKYTEGYFAPLWKDTFIADHLEDVENYLMHQSNNIGAVIIEPVLGEGGYVVYPDGWLHELRSICNHYDTLLIFDEVQTGIGRTGNMWASETFGVTPDVLLFAKGIASGLPLGGIISPRGIMDLWPTGTHGSTFGGNPVSCAAALATLDIVEPLLPRVRERGEQMLKRLSKLVPEARGVGYMVGLPLASQSDTEKVRTLCQEDGLLILSCGPEDDVLRLIPPLTINDSDLEYGVSILERNLRKL